MLGLVIDEHFANYPADPANFSVGVIAFHEKAGRSQESFFSLRLNEVCSSAEWPLSPCFHPHSQGAIRSLGACWAFSGD